MQKKDKDLLYQNMSYKGKFKRTLSFIPIVVVLCFLTPFFAGSMWIVYDVMLIGILALQIVYTYKMMQLEEQGLLEERLAPKNEESVGDLGSNDEFDE